MVSGQSVRLQGNNRALCDSVPKTRLLIGNDQESSWGAGFRARKASWRYNFRFLSIPPTRARLLSEYFPPCHASRVINGPNQRGEGSWLGRVAWIDNLTPVGHPHLPHLRNHPFPQVGGAHIGLRWNREHGTPGEAQPVPERAAPHVSKPCLFLSIFGRCVCERKTW